MRTSECLALEWSDIDFEAMQITINKSLIPRTGKIGTTKSPKSNRVIDIDLETVKTLKQFKTVFTSTCWSLGIQKQPNPIFYSFRMRTYTQYLTMLRRWKDFVDAIDIPYLKGLHCLRHTHATMCVASGMDYKVLQERLGHEKLEMTMDTYAHAMPEISKKAVDNIMKFMVNG